MESKTFRKTTIKTWRKMQVFINSSVHEHARTHDLLMRARMRARAPARRHNLRNHQT